MPPLAFTGPRFNPHTNINAPLNVVWQFMKGTKGIDGFMKVCLNEETLIVLFQMSTTAENHRRKIEKASLIPSFVSTQLVTADVNKVVRKPPVQQS